MKWLLFGMLVVGLGCGMENAAQGQWVDRKKLGDDVIAAYKQGQYERAVELGKQALKLAEREEGARGPAVVAGVRATAS